MYKIGEFSKITNLSIKTLHYYDEEKLLCPSNRSESGYRLYSDLDFKRAQILKLLRTLNFGIAEIKEIMKDFQKEDLPYYLEEKKDLILKHIEQEKALIKKLDQHLLKQKEEERKIMKYEITEKELPAMLVAYIHYQGNYSECGDYFGKIYKEVKNKACGAPIHYCYDEEYLESTSLDVCVPISGLVELKECSKKELPAIKAISTMHIGTYDTINLAYKALLDYASENNIEVTTPSRLVYHKGPGMLLKGNPDKYETEIIIPIK